MDKQIIVITEWLRSSILGIIILGALGSLLSILLLKLIPILIFYIKPTNWYKIKKFQAHRSMSYGFMLGILARIKDEATLNVFYSYNIVLFTGFAVISATSFISFLLLLLNSDALLLTTGAYIFLVISLVSTYFSYERLRYVRIAYRVDILPKLKKTKDIFDHIESNGNNNVEN